MIHKSFKFNTLAAEAVRNYGLPAMGWANKLETV